MKKRLYRIEDRKLLAGVCGGIAEYFNIDPTWIRLLWVVLSFIFGCGILAYLICALIIPRKSAV